MESLLSQCKWFRFYDIVERAWQDLRSGNRESFAGKFNNFCLENGIGWQLVNGEVTLRQSEAEEASFNTAVSELNRSGRPTAAKRLQESRQALSRRPFPDFSGAVSHATGALECVLGDITGEHMTLGDYLKKHSDLFHGALKKMLEGAWGYASDAGARHGKEGIEPPREEAEFVVGICASVANYLTRKHPGGQP